MNGSSAGSRVSWLLIAPSLLLAAAFFYYPALSGIYHAFTHWQAVDDSTWAGLENFRDMWRDPFMHHGLCNQALLLAVDLARSLLVPFLVAEMVSHLPSTREKYWMRTAFIIPIVTPAMVLALMWYFIYDPNIGLLNQALIRIGLGEWRQAWLGDPSTSMASIIFMGFPWIGSLAFLIFLAGLNNLPAELNDASRIDGATAVQRILRIDVPLLRPQFRLVVILTIIASIQDFGRILVLTSGGPGYSTYVPGLWMYQQTFLVSRFGYASAIGLLLFLMILAGSWITMRLLRSDDE